MTNPKTRGRAGVAALLASTAILLGSLWLAVGAGDPRDPAAPGETVGEAPDAGRDALLAEEADALCSRLKAAGEAGAPAVRADAVLMQDAPEKEPPVEAGVPRLVRLAAHVAGAGIVLAWDVEGDARVESFDLERIGPGGDAVRSWHLDGDRREYRDPDPVEALSGERTYRITAIGPGGRVSSPLTRTVSFRIDCDLAFLGPAAGAAGLFRLSVPDGPTVEFTVPPGGEIGGPRGETDWRTGSTFVGLRGRRVSETVEREVPVFGADGRPVRDPESGEIVTEKRAVAVPRMAVGALVRSADSPDGERWLPNSE